MGSSKGAWNLRIAFPSSAAALKRPLRADRVFCSWRLRNKRGAVPRKEGDLRLLRMILKTIRSLIFILSPYELSPWFIPDDFLPLCLLSCYSQVGTKSMGKKPKWASWCFPETTCMRSSRTGVSPSPSSLPSLTIPVLIDVPFPLLTPGTWGLSYTI